MKKKLTIVTILVLNWLAYKYFFGSKSATTTYQTAKADKGTIISSISVSGQVASNNSSPITTTATGVVSKVYVSNNDLVKSGQAIALIDLDMTSKSSYYQALSSYQGAKNSLENAKSGLYTAQSKMYSVNQKFINDAVARGLAVDDPTYIQQNADWKAAEGSYLTQQNAIKQAEISLSNSWIDLQQKSPTIYAPISGKVTGLSLQPGTIVTSTKVASIVTDAYPTVTINLTEVDVNKIKIGDKTTITIDSISDKTFSGQVISVDSVGAVTSGVTSYPAVIKLDTKLDQILPNMTAQTSIITAIKDDIVKVPSSAVLSQNGQATVKVMKNKKPETVNVSLGISSSSETEIVSGINEGDEVVTATITPITSSSNNTSTSASPFSALGGTNRSGTNVFRAVGGR